jgi:hypothetical protein
LDWRRGVSLAGAALTGILIMKIVRDAGAAATPTKANSGGPTGLATVLTRPYLAAAGAAVIVVVVAVVVVTALARSGRLRTGTPRGVSGALVVCLLAGLCMATAYSNVARMLRESSAHGWRDASAPRPIVTGGTLEAGRWLRDHSHPDDLVATNVHCLAGAATECLNLHFSVAAFTERRVLVEGWGFTAKAHDRAGKLGVPAGDVPFWKPELLAANDAAFTATSAATLGDLRTRYGVTWLFVDETRSPVSPRLADFAVFRFRSGGCAVYELVDVTAGSSRSVSSAGR